MYIDRPTLERAVENLYGTAGHLLKIWFTLKHMGLAVGASPVKIDTSNSTPSLERLFSCGAPDGEFYVPFAHTRRYTLMKHHAARSIIQTTIERWASSGSVVTCDPTDYLEIVRTETGNKLEVSTGRRYPFGLGYGESGFALEDGQRVQVPLRSFAYWYGRQTEIPKGEDAEEFLLQEMIRDLHISPSERELVFTDDSTSLSLQRSPLSDQEIFQVCETYINGVRQPQVQLKEEFPAYVRRVKSMVSSLDQPSWMRVPPEKEVYDLISGGAKAILLYGPPRTGKTRLIDQVVPRDSVERVTIQIHDGWGYDHLVEGLKPDKNGNWGWKDGPLKRAVSENKKFFVLEEVNRTIISQALGEVFSLIEEAYRGESNAVELRSGEKFWIPEDTIFLLTMNTIDKSTEEIDDALMGRVAAVEFSPRTEDLAQMLEGRELPSAQRSKLGELFAEIQKVYPLGHGYFAGLSGGVTDSEIIHYYKARIRPVLRNFLGELKQNELAKIDNIVDQRFAS